MINDGGSAGRTGGGLGADDRAPVAITALPGSIYDSYMKIATDPRHRGLSPAEVAVAAAGVGASLSGEERWPAGRAAGLCKRAAVHLGADDPFVALSIEITDLYALYESSDGATHLADPAARAILGDDWARVVGEAAGRLHPLLGTKLLSQAARDEIDAVAIETDELFSRIAACYDGRLAPRSLAEAAVVGARIIESSGLGLGATSIGGCCIVGMGAGVGDLPAAERGAVFDPIRFCEEMHARTGGDHVSVSDDLEANAAYFASWRERQIATSVEDILSHPSYAGGAEPFTVKKMVQPLLDAVPGDLFHLAYLIGCAPLLGWFACVPASYVTRLSAIEHYEMLCSRQAERDATRRAAAAARRHETELLRDALDPVEVAPGLVVYGEDERLCFEELVDFVIGALEKDGVELGPYGREFLSNSITEVVERDVAPPLSWRATGEIVGPASLCICDRGGGEGCRCDPVEIVESQVVFVYDALCFDVIEPFTLLVAHQGPPTSPAGWPKRAGGRGQGPAGR